MNIWQGYNSEVIRFMPVKSSSVNQQHFLVELKDQTQIFHRRGCYAFLYRFSGTYTLRLVV